LQPIKNHVNDHQQHFVYTNLHIVAKFVSIFPHFPTINIQIHICMGWLLRKHITTRKTLFCETPYYVFEVCRVNHILVAADQYIGNRFSFSTTHCFAIDLLPVINLSTLSLGRYYVSITNPFSHLCPTHAIKRRYTSLNAYFFHSILMLFLWKIPSFNDNLLNYYVFFLL
jgi:hypothetical protein